jgi:hypothetical protein
LGIVWIKYESHDIAKMVVAKEDGNKVGIGTEGKEVKVELDAGERCRELVKEELARRRNKNDPRKPPSSSSLAPPDSAPSSANNNNTTENPLPNGVSKSLPSSLPPRPTPATTAPVPIHITPSGRKGPASRAPGALMGSRMAITPPPSTIPLPSSSSKTQNQNQSGQASTGSQNLNRPNEPPLPPPRDPTPPLAPPPPTEPPPPLPKPQSEEDKEEDHERLTLVLQKVKF